MIRILILTLLTLLASQAYAHKPSDSYLQLTPTEQGFTGEWRIALRDLEPAVGLDRDGDHKITWGEVRTRHAEIAKYALARLSITANKSSCDIHAGSQLVDDLSDGTYTVLPLVVTCEHNVAPWAIDYSLLFDLDATHRGMITLRDQTFVLSPQNHQAMLSAGAPQPARQFVEMAREGVWHIWIGFDHILFLLALLLPLGLRAKGEPILKDVLALVTAFTVAHSITLSLAALKIISLPPRLIETTIAVSIVVAALRMRSATSLPVTWIAFGFGLIHGFGFANVLADMQLPSGSMALSLFAFNVGVELGQCAIVLLVLPMITYAQRRPFYQRSFMPAAAVIIAAIGVIWSLERGAGLLSIELPLGL